MKDEDGGRGDAEGVREVNKFDSLTASHARLAC